MMGSYDHIWAKSEMRGAVSLAMHLRQTARGPLKSVPAQKE